MSPTLARSKDCPSNVIDGSSVAVSNASWANASGVNCLYRDSEF